jgi:hypothetical protein
MIAEGRSTVSKEGINNVNMRPDHQGDDVPCRNGQVPMPDSAAVEVTPSGWPRVHQHRSPLRTPAPLAACLGLAGGAVPAEVSPR